MDTACCGKITNSAGKVCAGEECGVLCCDDCRSVCQGWDRLCTCMTDQCLGQNVGCKSGHVKCSDESAFCKVCAKQHTMFRQLKCDGCYDRKDQDAVSDMSDDSNYGTESSESDEELDADMKANEEGWTAPAKGHQFRPGLSFPDDLA